MRSLKNAKNGSKRTQESCKMERSGDHRSNPAKRPRDPAPEQNKAKFTSRRSRPHSGDTSGDGSTQAMKDKSGTSISQRSKKRKFTSRNSGPRSGEHSVDGLPPKEEKNKGSRFAMQEALGNLN